MTCWNLTLLATLITLSLCQSRVSAGKNIVDYDESDMERLFQQWEENDEESELDSDKQTKPSNFNTNGKIDPQDLLKMSKKGKPVMVFVGVRGTPDQVYTEQVSSRWMQSLHNVHIQMQRYIVAPNRVLFMIEDGSLAWDIKDYLTSLTECTTVSFDQLSFDCKDNKKEEL